MESTSGISDTLETGELCTARWRRNTCYGQNIQSYSPHCGNHIKSCCRHSNLTGRKYSIFSLNPLPLYLDLWTLIHSVSTFIYTFCISIFGLFISIFTLSTLIFNLSTLIYFISPLWSSILVPQSLVSLPQPLVSAPWSLIFGLDSLLDSNNFPEFPELFMGGFIQSKYPTFFL